MKGIGKILLYVFAALALIGFVWVLFSPNAAGADIDKASWMENPLTTYMIWVSIIAIVVTTLIFAFYKVIDLVKHPSHVKEAVYVAGAIVIAAVIGFIFSGSEEVFTPRETVTGMQSKLIGTGIIMTGVLLVTGLVFLAWDTIKGLLKG